MPHEFVIEEVTEILIGGELRHAAWRVDIMKPDLGIEGHWLNGTLHNQHIPKAAMEWRMAEYDMDTDEAMDLLLHEPFIESIMQLPEAEEDVSRVAKKISRTVVTQGIAEERPILLYNANSRGEAAEAVRSRLTVAKNRMQIVTKNVTRRGLLGTPVYDPLEFMKQTSNATRSRVDEKRQFIIAMRQEQGLDLDLPPARLPEKYEMIASPQPPMDETMHRRIVEQKRDPKDHMWG